MQGRAELGATTLIDAVLSSVKQTVADGVIAVDSAVAEEGPVAAGSLLHGMINPGRILRLTLIWRNGLMLDECNGDVSPTIGLEWLVRR
jgi:hypothetical protein